MPEKIAVIGAGSWGTALSILLSGNGHRVRVWSRSENEVSMINSLREHKSKLPGVRIPENIEFTSDLERSLADSDVVVMVVPSQTIRNNAREISKYIKKGTLIVHCSKGFEEGSGMRLSEVVRQEIPESMVVVLSGPSHAEEVGRQIPTTVVSACEDRRAAEYVQDIFMSSKFRVYTNPDVTGVEIGAALKNVIALCAGISDGLGFGDNTKAALMTRGITEIARLGTVMGAKPETFAGLSGIGDLIVTCTSMHSRNRRAGILIGQGMPLDEVLKEVKMVVEGVTTTKAAYELANRMNVQMPITAEAYRILFEGKNAKQAVSDLMMRNRKFEMEEVAEGSKWL